MLSCDDTNTIADLVEHEKNMSYTQLCLGSMVLPAGALLVTACQGLSV